MLKKIQKLPIAFKVWRRHRKSGLFDFEWYLRRNPDVRAATKRPFLHFAMHGIFEGRAPNASFQNDAYLAANPDIAQSGLPPVQHYVLQGYFHNRLLAPLPRPEEKRLERENQSLLRETNALKHENELLVLQLQAGMEEIEGHIKKAANLTTERDRLKSELADQTRALLEQAQSASEREEAIKDQLENARVLASALNQSLELRMISINAEKEALVAERDELMAGQGGLVAERDAVAAERMALDARLTAVLAEKEVLVAERDELIRSTSEQKQQAVYYMKERDSNYKAFVEKNAEYDKLQARVKEVEDAWGVLASERDVLQKEGLLRSQIASEEIQNAERQLEVLKDLIRIPLR
jgi:hypothetical protein